MSLMARLQKQQTKSSNEKKNANHTASSQSVKQDPMQELKVYIHERMVHEIDSSLLSKAETEDGRKQLTEKVSDVVSAVIAEESIATTQITFDQQKFLSEIVDEVVGLGPITPLLHDPEVTEVMVNGYDKVYVERRGRIHLTNVVFRDDQHVHHIIEKIVSPLGRRIDESSPMVDARLPDGSRVNAIVPPLALNGPILTIRKFSETPLTAENLIEFGTLTQEMVDFLTGCVNVRLNIVVSGGTGSGKTTLLNVLSSFIPSDERIITVEDAAELKLAQEHVVSLETRPPNIEGKGSVTIRDLVRNALRMRPDRIVVGEVRGGEALDMLQAMNTGHDGSLTTGHANSPRDMLSRLETMVLMSGMDLPVRAIREQIASAIDLIVQQSRMRDGSRKVTKITEVQGMEGEVITLQDIFVFKQKGIDEEGYIQGKLQPTGIRPKFSDLFSIEGVELPPNIFGGV